MTLLLAPAAGEQYNVAMSWGIVCRGRMIAGLAVGLMMAPSATALAAPLPIMMPAASPEIIITEVQAAGGKASEEFIELYNATAEDINFSDAGGGIWKLQFFSAASVAQGAPNWQQPASAVNLTGTLPAHSYYVLMSNDYVLEDVEPDQLFSGRMASTGGGIQLVQAGKTAMLMYDRVMWSSVRPLVAGVWPAASSGNSLQRLPNEDDEYLDGQGGLAGFTDEGPITPGDMWTAPLPEEPDIIEPLPDNDGEVVTVPEDRTSIVAPAHNYGLLPPVISELLPNPAVPAKDETDEYIELYNPNGVDYVLAGYTVEVESTKIKSFTITDSSVIPAQGYFLLYSSDSRLAMTNSGATIRLRAPDGNPLSVADPYTAAKEGMAWAKFAKGWQWTLSLTPGEDNTLDDPAAGTVAASVAKTAAIKAKTPKVKGASTTKAKKVKAPKAKKVKKARKEPKAEAAAVASLKEPEPKSIIHTEVLAVVAGLAVLYGAYEYRHDIANRFHQLGHYRAVRGRNGPQASRRRGHSVVQ